MDQSFGGGRLMRIRILGAAVVLLLSVVATAEQRSQPEDRVSTDPGEATADPGHMEQADDAPVRVLRGDQERSAAAPVVRGNFRSIQVNEGCHPYIGHWWPPGHGIGYENTFVNEYADFLQAIADDAAPEPGFEVGLENQRVLEAVTRSIADDRWVVVD